VKGDSQARISDADRAVLSDLVLSAYRSQFRAGQLITAVNQLATQVADTAKSIKEVKDAPADVRKSVDSLATQVRDLQQKVGLAMNQLAQASRAGDQSTSLPSRTTINGVAEANDELNNAAAVLNDIISKSAPALNDQLDKAKVPATVARLKPGSPVSIQ
jgi:phage shock protein A